MPRKFTLKNARLIAGFTAEQVAQKTNIHINTIYSYENFKSFPRVDTARELANLYGVRFDDLIFFQDNIN